MHRMDLQKMGYLDNASTVAIPDSHVGCMVCGANDSLGLKFQAHEQGVIALFQASPQWQGYQGVLHGGMISTLLDAAMTHCLFRHGIEAMTAHLQVRFLKTVPCTQWLQLQAQILSQRHHLYQLSAELSCAGEILARSEARFLRRK